MRTIKTVAFLGAGAMGGPMALRAKAAGFAVRVCDRDPAVLARFTALGVPASDRVADCAQADAVVVLLANDAQILAALLGEGGLAGAIEPGHELLVCMMSTTLPQTLQGLRAPLASAGARLLDAPVSGGVVGAQEGTLTVLLGGEPADIEAATPLMRAMGRHLFPCGPLGAGEVVKIINNMLCVANMFLTAEAIELAQSHGVTLEQLAPILSVSTGLNFLTADAELARAQYRAWVPDEAGFQGIHRIVAKDLHLALALAEGRDLGLLQRISVYVDEADPLAPGRWLTAGRPA
ncbi:NAD(P)-dependent oxidoreductase [Bordetella trematum]|uniref:NAD(P)-dependent oxidoreductase n=1 Tax=Bordetella trematum TaxID=123899 RepID=UPI003AF37426